MDDLTVGAGGDLAGTNTGAIPGVASVADGAAAGVAAAETIGARRQGESAGAAPFKRQSYSKNSMR